MGTRGDLKYHGVNEFYNDEERLRLMFIYEYIILIYNNKRRSRKRLVCQPLTTNSGRGLNAAHLRGS